MSRPLRFSMMRANPVKLLPASFSFDRASVSSFSLTVPFAAASICLSTAAVSSLTAAVAARKSAVERFCALIRRMTSRVSAPPPRSLILDILDDPFQMTPAADCVHDSGVDEDRVQHRLPPDTPPCQGCLGPYYPKRHRPHAISTVSFGHQQIGVLTQALVGSQ